MELYYSKPRFIKIKTIDGDLYFDKALLKKSSKLAFDILEDYPESESITIDIKSKILNSLLLFIDQSTDPIKEEWLEIIEAAEYLYLTDAYNNKLVEKAKDFILKQNGFVEYCDKYKLKDLAGKIKDPTYITSEEQERITKIHKDREELISLLPKISSEDLKPKERLEAYMILQKNELFLQYKAKRII